MEQSGSSAAPQRALVEVAAALIFRDKKLLITQRRRQDALGGLWEFPGGKREGAETFEACLRREIEEELGLRLEPGPLIDSLVHHYPDKSVHLKFFKCRCDPGTEPKALACAALAWIGREGLERYAFPAADARLLDRLKSSPEIWE